MPLTREKKEDSPAADPTKGLDYLWNIIEDAKELSVKLGVAGDLPIWEAHAVSRHQLEVKRIDRSIEPAADDAGGCGCISIPDVYIRFPDGSLLRPDISIFCKMPGEQDSAITLVPEAIIEVISRGFERKDLEIGIPFFLSQGVKDVIVFDPYTNEVTHARHNGVRTLESPMRFRLECGCTCIV